MNTVSKSKGAIGVLSSGGDAQGMSAAIRAVTRAGLATGFQVYGIYEGYQGLVENNISELTYDSVSGVMEYGGTFLGTARSKEFRYRSGLLKAAENLLRHNIDKLVVIGGDGSLAGADDLRANWQNLVEELAATGRIPEGCSPQAKLRIVGIVGSIDNDMADTDMTIGADSALHRICEAVDALETTAYSHQRTFIVEVMGRNCGYLALMSGLATGAAAVFIPEAPPAPNWEEALCKLIKASQAAGRHDHILIVAEGARDRQGQPITATYIQDILNDRLDIESRVTILGHVQRGGAPSAYDRYTSTAFGWAAIRTFVQDPDSNESQMIALQGHRVVAVPLMDAVAKTRATAAAIKAGDFRKADKLRGNDWCQMNGIYQTLCMAVPTLRDPASTARQLRLGVLCCGWAAPGMNGALRTVSRLATEAGHTIVGIVNAVDGLLTGECREFDWMEVEDWSRQGGCVLGATRKLPEDSDMGLIAENLKKWQLDGLLMIGGWTGYLLAGKFAKFSSKYPVLNLPLVCIPASINNNLPGSELALGADTALNTIVEAIDKIKHSADSAKRVFIVEVMGRYCGYLATMSGLATGAEYIYTHEEGLTLAKLQHDIEELKEQYSSGERHVALIIRNELANPIYTTEFIEQLFTEEGQGFFDIRKAILGPMQQGGTPSPFDRILAVRLAHFALCTLVDRIKEQIPGGCALAQRDGKLQVLEWDELQKQCEFEYQRPLNQWWISVKKMVDMLNRPVANQKNNNFFA